MTAQNSPESSPQVVPNHYSSPARAPSSSNDSDQLGLLLAAQQQLQRQQHQQQSAPDVSPTLVALLMQQQQLQSQQQLTPQMLALLQQQRQQHDSLIALQLGQMQQQQHHHQNQPQQRDGLFSGLGSANSLDMLLAQQHLLKQLGTPAMLGAPYLNGSAADGLSTGLGQLSSAVSRINGAIWVSTSSGVMDPREEPVIMRMLLS